MEQGSDEIVKWDGWEERGQTDLIVTSQHNEMAISDDDAKNDVIAYVHTQCRYGA